MRSFLPLLRIKAHCVDGSLSHVTQSISRSYCPMRSPDQLREFCHRLPKVELHAHLNGSISMKTIQKLMVLNNNPMAEIPKILDQPSTMEEVFKLFPVIHDITSTHEAIKLATMDVISDFTLDNTVYLEIRSTPKNKPTLSKKKYVEAIIEGIRASSHLPITVRLLLSIDRRQSLEDAEDTVQMAINDESGLIVGVELSGDPSVDGRKFLPLFRKARNSGLHVAIHLAEINTCLSEVDEFLDFGPDRIGHGTFLHYSKDWEAIIVKKKIPFEICLTSNYLSKTTPTVADSHLSFWRSRGNPVAISTDDMGLMGTTFTHEFFLAATTFSLTKNDLVKIVQDSLKMAFLPRTSKVYKQIENKIRKFELTS